MLSATLFNFGSSIVGTIIKVRVLVVDHDSTCLSMISGILKLLKYQVGTAKSAAEAKSVLDANKGSYDLVLAEVHLPTMNGVELRKIVENDFQVPVLLMTSDHEREKMIEELGLDKDARVILKPTTAEELQEIWHYVIACRKNKSNNMKHNNKYDPIRGKIKRSSKKRNSTAKEEENNNNNNNNNNNDDDEEEDDGDGHNPKKRKLIWTTPLHCKFLEAVKTIGYNNVVPKNILEYMNVPGLTRGHVASHLQKYRTFLRELCEAVAMAKNGISENWNQHSFGSNFTWGEFPALATNMFLLRYANAFKTIDENQGKGRASSSKNVVATTEDHKRIVRPPDNDNSSSPSFLVELKNLLDTSTAPNHLNNFIITDPLTILESSIGKTKSIDINTITLGNNSNGSVLTSAPMIMHDDALENFDNGNDMVMQQDDLFLGDRNDVENHIDNVMAQPPSVVTAAQENNMAISCRNQHSGIANNNIPINNVSQPCTRVTNLFSQHEPSIATSMSNFVEQPPPPAPPSSMIEICNFVEQPPPPSSSMIEMCNFVEQPPPLPSMTEMCNFFEQPPPSPSMAEMYKFIEQSSLSPPSLMTKMCNVVEQPPPPPPPSTTFHMTEMCNFVEQPAPPPPPSMTKMCTFFEQPPLPSMTKFCNFVDQPSPSSTNFRIPQMCNFVEQPPPPSHSTNFQVPQMCNIVEQPPYQQCDADIATFVTQQPQHVGDVANIMSNFSEPKSPQFSIVFSNMPTNMNNILSLDYQQVTKSNNMNNIFLTPEQVVMPNNVNVNVNVNTSATQSMVDGNQLDTTTFTSSNGVHDQGRIQGFDLTGVAVDQHHDWKMSTAYDDFYLQDHLEAFVDGLLSDDDPQNGDNYADIP